MSKTSKAPAAATRQPNLPIAVLVWRGNEDVTRLGFTDPLEALLTAITYLRNRYSVRMTDAACDALEAMAPELERLLPSEGGSLKAARGAVRKRVPAAGPPAPRGAVTAVPAGERQCIPAAVFSGPFTTEAADL